MKKPLLTPIERFWVIAQREGWEDTMLGSQLNFKLAWWHFKRHVVRKLKAFIHLILKSRKWQKE